MCFEGEPLGGFVGRATPLNRFGGLVPVFSSGGPRQWSLP